MIRLYLASNEVLNRWWPWDCEFELSLNSRPETISLFSGTPLGDAALDSVGGDDQLLGSEPWSVVVISLLLHYVSE